MTEGYIYCLSNPSFVGLLKIGETMRTPEDRAKELFTTGVPTPFKVEFSRKVANTKEKEKDIHKILESYRVPSREFFNVTVEEAMRVIDVYLSEDIPVFLSVEDVLRSEKVSKLDKSRMISCLRKNKNHQEMKEHYELLNGDEKKNFYDMHWSIWEQAERFIENTSIIWTNDKTLIYKVNHDASIEYVKSLKTSAYHSIRTGE